MGAWLRPRWQNLSKPLLAIIALVFLGIIVLILVIILGYTYHLDWTGLTGGYSTTTITNTVQGTTTAIEQPVAKTLWDWLQLLIIPVVLAVGGYLFNLTTSRNDQRTTADNQQEMALQSYIDKMSELLLERHLGKPRDGKSPEDYEEECTIARARTLTVLPRLDPRRKGRILQFLYESELIGGYQDGSESVRLPVIDLTGADFSGVDLGADQGSSSGANLRDANLRGVQLRGAQLTQADLTNAVLSDAHLSDADLRGAILKDAIMSRAYLSDVLLCAIFQSDKKGSRAARDPAWWRATHTAADLTNAKLNEAKLHEANLTNAKLIGADLTNADLSQANLSGATVTQTQLAMTLSLQGARGPDGKPYRTI